MFHVPNLQNLISNILSTFYHLPFIINCNFPVLTYIQKLLICNFSLWKYVLYHDIEQIYNKIKFVEYKIMIWIYTFSPFTFNKERNVFSYSFILISLCNNIYITNELETILIMLLKLPLISTIWRYIAKKMWKWGIKEAIRIFSQVHFSIWYVYKLK